MWNKDIYFIGAAHLRLIADVQHFVLYQRKRKNSFKA